MGTGKYTVLDLAAEVLKRASKPLTYEEISELGRDMPMASALYISGRPPGQALGARLLVDTRDNPRTRFMKLGRNPTRFWLERRRAELTPAHFRDVPVSKVPPRQRTAPSLPERDPTAARPRRGTSEPGAPARRAVEELVSPGIEGDSGFLGRICVPVAAEFGQLLQDRARAWRAANAARVSRKAEQTHRANGVPLEYHADPRLVGAIIEHGSWTQDELVQEYWGGLLCSSCSRDGTDDSNLVLIDLLSRLVVSQVRLLDHVCLEAGKRGTKAGRLIATRFQLQTAELVRITGLTDPLRLERELDHLRSLGLFALLRGGSALTDSPADVTPSSLALHLFARAHGFAGDPVEYFRGLGAVADPPAT